MIKKGTPASSTSALTYAWSRTDARCTIGYEKHVMGSERMKQPFALQESYNLP